jgi:hypothetical protein
MIKLIPSIAKSKASLIDNPRSRMKKQREMPTCPLRVVEIIQKLISRSRMLCAVMVFGSADYVLLCLTVMPFLSKWMQVTCIAIEA